MSWSKPGVMPGRSRADGRIRTLQIDCLELRCMLAAASGANPGLLTFDSATNVWADVQYDGTGFAQDVFLSSAATGNWQAPLMGDFNGDAKQEIIARDLLSGDWWMFGGNDQVPRRICNWSPGSDYQFLQVADTNGDGSDDVVGRSTDGSWWAIQATPQGYHNVLLGHWSNPANWSSILFGDLDGNGTVDIVGRDHTTGYWWKIGYEGQQYTNSIFAHWNPEFTYSNIQLADTNGDGIVNVIGFASDNSCWTIERHNDRFLNVYVGQWDLAIDWQFAGIGDLDGNGSGDLAARNPTTGAWVVLQYRNGSYQTQTINSWSPTCTYSAVQVIDLNGDGRAEIVGFSNAGEWWATAFNGSWYSNQLLAQWGQGELLDVRSGDFNGDGTTDISGLRPDGRWYTLSFQDVWYLTQATASSAGRAENSKGTYSGDLNGDGRDELVAWNRHDGLFRAFDLGTGSPHEQILPGLLTSPLHADAIYQLDLEGDGLPEAVFWDRSTGSWYRLVMDGNVVSQQLLTQIGTDVMWQEPIVTDLDGDGHEELALRDAASGVWWTILVVNGQGRWSPIAHWNPAQSFSDLQSIDLNGDGRQEIVGRADNGEWWALTNQLGLVRNVALGKWTSDPWTSLNADLNGDGVRELVGFNHRTHQWRQIRSEGASYVDEVLASWPEGDAYENLLAADLDGDGAEELIGRDATTGAWRKFSLADPASTQVIATWGGDHALTSMVAGDFDGDGINEIAAQSGADGTWGLLDFESGSYSMQSRTITPSAENVQAADLNLDGRDDIFWQNRSTGMWFITDLSQEITQPVLSSRSSAVLMSDLPGYFNTQVRSQVLREMPELSAALASDPVQAAIQLLNWCANAANFDFTGDTNTQTTNALMGGRIAQVYYEQFVPNRGAVLCGGFAAFYSGVLNLFGINNFTVDFGDQRDGLTHVTVVVPIWQSSAWQYYILDPTFNLTFVMGATDQMMTWFDLLDTRAAGHADQIGWRTQPLDQRDWLSYDSGAPAGQEYSAIKIPDYGLETYLANNATNLTRNGYQTGIAGFVQLMEAQVFGIGSSLIPEARDAFINELHRRGISAPL